MLQPKIIAMSGRKSAGKNTIAKVIADWFCEKLNKRPDLLPNYAAYQCVQEYSFADNLKSFCINTLGFSYEQCYGTDDQKNSPTKYKWDDLHAHLRWKFGTKEFVSQDGNVFAVPLDVCLKSEDWIATYYRGGFGVNKDCTPIGLRTGYLSARDAMQLIGTELIRDTFGNVWAEATVRAIKTQNKLLSIVTDNRFPNEVEALLKEPNSYVIRLNRNPFGSDCHQSEIALDNYDWFKERCFLVNNQDMTLQEQSQAISNILDIIYTGEF